MNAQANCLICSAGQMTAVNSPASSERAESPIHIGFFKASIAIVLTMGAVWGAWLLLRIGFSGSFTTVSVHEVNAHGHAQIFGWVGLFVMGFAYQMFPRLWQTPLAWPEAARTTLGMMVAGILLRSVCEPLVTANAAWTAPALAGGGLEIAAIGIFAAVIWRTIAGSDQWIGVSGWFILSAVAWFFIQAVYETIYFGATALAPGRDALLKLISTWQAPLRDAQIHGFAMIMILGVSQRLLPRLFGWGGTSPRRGAWALAALNLGVIGEIAGLILMRMDGHRWAGLWYLSVLMIIGALAVLMWEWKIWRRPALADRSVKFVRAAYLWLGLSFVMLALLPAYQFGLLRMLAPESEAARIGFSHAFYGATRHAITVGFISLMILGISLRVVPALRGIDWSKFSAMWVPFVLINLGCALRVAGQTLTDFAPMAFPFTGMSGLLEVTGLAIWGAHLWKLMRSSGIGAGTKY